MQLTGVGYATAHCFFRYIEGDFQRQAGSHSHLLFNTRTPLDELHHPDGFFRASPSHRFDGFYIGNAATRLDDKTKFYGSADIGPESSFRISPDLSPYKLVRS